MLWKDNAFFKRLDALQHRHPARAYPRYLMPDETALRELSEGVIEKLKLLTDAEFAELEFPPN